MNKICTSQKQSEKFKELEIDITTADMYYSYDYNIDEYEEDAQIIPQSEVGQHFSLFPEDIPAWSLAALFGILPKFIGDYGKCLYYDVNGYYCGYMADGDFMLTIEETKVNNPIDACYEMILKLYELKML